MTNADVMTQILSEATGKPAGEVRGSLAQLVKLTGRAGNLNAELADADATRLVSSLRRELPSIRAWLLQGSRN